MSEDVKSDLTNSTNITGTARPHSVTYVLPHAACIAALAAFAFGGRWIDGSAMIALRVAVAVCLFIIAAWSETAARTAPRWLLVVLGVVFIVPVEPPLNVSGWRVLAWLAGFTTIADVKTKIDTISGSAASISAGRWVMDAALWTLVLSLLLMLRCGESYASSQ